MVLNLIMKNNFDLFEVLSKLSARKLDVFDSLTDEAVKEFQPLIIQRWLSGSTNELQIIRLNEFVNKFIFSLPNEKELLLKLMGIACSGNVKKCNWIKIEKNKNNLAVQVIKNRYNCSTREAKEHLNFLNKEDILEFAAELGMEKNDISKLQKEYTDKYEQGKSKRAC